MELRAAPGVLGSSVIPSFGLGEAVDEVAEVAGADQPADGRMIAWRHGPVIAGGAAAPDPPVRVLAAEPLEFGALVVPALAGVHGGRQLTAGPACAPWMAPDMACAGMPPRGGKQAAGGQMGGCAMALPFSRVRYGRAWGRAAQPPAAPGG
jgi:hypothetical protein